MEPHPQNAVLNGREREFLVGAKNETASSEDASLLLSHPQDGTMI